MTHKNYLQAVKRINVVQIKIWNIRYKLEFKEGGVSERRTNVELYNVFIPVKFIQNFGKKRNQPKSDIYRNQINGNHA